MYLNLAPVAATQGDGGHQTKNADDATYLFIVCFLFFLSFERLINQQHQHREGIGSVWPAISFPFSWAELNPDRFVLAYSLRILHLLASVRPIQ